MRANDLPLLAEFGGFMTLQRASEITGYTKKHLAHLLRSGAVSGARIDDRTLVIRRRSLLAYIAEGIVHDDARRKIG